MPECNLYTALLALLGMVVLFFFLLDSLWSTLQLSRSLLAPFLLNNEETSLVKKFGQWALVTGSTDGIGKEYANELARYGVNIILASRNIEKLRNTAQEIESEHGVKTKIIQVDFSLGRQAIDTVKRELGDLDVAILVNNVGKNYEYPMYLGEVPKADLWDIININVGATTMLTRALIEDMKRRGRGAVVNISSGSELQPLPLMTVYAASKAYIKSFTAALRYEYSQFGIKVQHLAPLFTCTKMNSFSQRLQTASLFVPSPKTYAKYAVSTLGKMDESTGYWAHGIQYFFTKLPPVWIRMHIGGHMNKIFRKDYFAIRSDKS